MQFKLAWNSDMVNIYGREESFREKGQRLKFVDAQSVTENI